MRISNLPAAVLAAAILLSAAMAAVTTPVLSWKTGDRSRPLPPKVTAGGQPGQAPSDAVVLFNGKDLSAWQQKQGGGPAKWRVVDGHFETALHTGDIVTRQAFGDCQLHVEWSSPTPTRGTDQGPGNSGVYLKSLYEIQILDSYENKTYADGQAAAIYCQYPPLANASRRPGEWQTYDIVFHDARFSPSGELLSLATVTLFHNGVLAQDHVSLTGPSDYMKRPPYRSHADKLPLLLQDHDQPVRFRNVWIRELKPAQ
ncbi:MAG: DUF1080 domain-containing protein [Acidobacteria bacterium]|nr:DUF1080 domain-containing protein [Acidobacteriota bacterium]